MSSAMQRQAKQSNSRPAQVAKGKAFCAVCKNAGKSEYEYTNHYTKSVPGPTGVVVCPTILSAECSYCHKTGHFKNACPILLDRDNQARRSEKFSQFSQKKEAQVAAAPVKKPTPVARANLFSLLDDSDDSDSSPRQVEKSTPVEDFPPLSSHSVIQRTPSSVPAGVSSEMSYAERAAKPPSTAVARFSAVKPAVQEYPVTTIVFPRKVRDIHHSWADDDYWGSSDDEDD